MKPMLALAVGCPWMILLTIGAHRVQGDEGTGPLATTQRDAAVRQQADADALAQIKALPTEAAIFANRTGLCLDLGCGGGSLAAEIAGKTRYSVFAVARNEDDCQKARQAFDKADLYGTRATAVVGSLHALPFPNGYGHLIVTGEYADDLNLKEVLRVLNPNGLAIIGGGKADANKLKAALDAAGVKDYKLVGNSAIFRGRMPEGSDDWTHANHRPDNIATSTETADPGETAGENDSQQPGCPRKVESLW